MRTAENKSDETWINKGWDVIQPKWHIWQKYRKIAAYSV